MITQHSNEIQTCRPNPRRTHIYTPLSTLEFWIQTRCTPGVPPSNSTGASSPGGFLANDFRHYPYILFLKTKHCVSFPFWIPPISTCAPIIFMREFVYRTFCHTPTDPFSFTSFPRVLFWALLIGARQHFASARSDSMRFVFSGKFVLHVFRMYNLYISIVMITF